MRPRGLDHGQRLDSGTQLRTDRRHGADSRHVPQSQQQAPTRHGCVSAGLDGVDFHAGGGAQSDQHPGAAGILAAVRRTPGRQRAAPGAFEEAGHLVRACRAGEHHHHGGRDACAGHRQPDAASAGGPCDGRGPGLGGGIRPAHGPGHAPAARAARTRRAQPGRDGTLLPSAPAQALRERERVPQPHGILPVAGQRAPRAAAGQPAQLPHRRGRHLQPHRARTRHPAVRARRPAADDSRQRLRQDPGAELARRIPGCASRPRRAFAGHQAAVHLDHAGPAGKSAGPVHGARAAAGAMPSGSGPGWMRRAAAA